jgi:DNA-binding transcriptional LysR family regulator
MQIDLVQLHTFVVAAEELHLTRAAERLHISLSAASAHVKAVEETLGSALFVRTRRRLELTQAGEMLLERAKQLLAQAAQFSSYARELRGQLEGQLTIGASSESASTGLGQVVGRLRRSHPLITVDLRVRHSSSSRQALKTGELDISMLLARSIDPEFAYQRVGTVNFRVAGPASWREQIESAGWAELAAMPWITTTEPNMAYSVLLRELFQPHGLELNAVARFDNAALGRAMLEAGVGLMLMRDEHVRQGLEQGSLAVSPIAIAEIPLMMAHLASRSLDPLIVAFLQIAREVWPQMRPAQFGPAQGATTLESSAGRS